MNGNGFHVKECYDYIDLRSVVAQSSFLRREAKKHALKHGECIVYTNAALTRFRLILKIRDAALMCIPEIDMGSKRSAYLHVSEELSKLAGRDAQIKLSQIQQVTADRIQKRIARERALRLRTQ